MSKGDVGSGDPTVTPWCGPSQVGALDFSCKSLLISRKMEISGASLLVFIFYREERQEKQGMRYSIFIIFVLVYLVGFVILVLFLDYSLS